MTALVRGGSALFALILLIACSRTGTEELDRSDLFSIQIGRMEDELDFFGLEGGRSQKRSALAMRDGLFYISNGNGQKISHYNSYGDLLFMIYNEASNPPPMSLRPRNGELVTRWAVPYPLREPGLITVDSRKHLYVEDRYPRERWSTDPENGAILDSFVLHFDTDGNFVQYLGREGIGGTPFPRITGIYSSLEDEIAVVCRHGLGWIAYWFDSRGTLLYQIRVDGAALPIPSDREQVIPSVDAVAAAPDARLLYMKVDYYRSTYDPSTDTRSGSEGDSSVVWVLSAENGAWVDRIEVPFYEVSIGEAGRRVREKLFYSLLQVARGGHIFLRFPVEEGYALLIMDAHSPTQRRGFIEVRPEELQMNIFDLSEEGILSALLVSDWEVHAVWWRTDRVLSEDFGEGYGGQG
jgi:hypothetical protein